jgi:spore coat polysaccharide biosynthesis predicted glycosyltransferase SpsG
MAWSHCDVVVIDRRHYIPAPVTANKVVRIFDEELYIGPNALAVFGGAGAKDYISYALCGPRFAMLRPEFRALRQDRTRAGIFDARQVFGLSALNLATSMASAEVVVTYSGMRAMEATCVGAPTVLVVRNHGERINADGLVAAGCSIVATEELAMQTASSLLSQAPELLPHMRERALGLVDGLGCSRVADAIEGLFR